MIPPPEQQRLDEIKADIRDLRGSAPALYSIALSLLAELRDSKSAAEALNADVSHLGRELEQAQARERGLLQALEGIAAMPRAPEAGWLMSTEAPQMAEEALAEALAAQSEGSGT